MTARVVLDGIKARLAGATPGPWRWDEDYGDKGDTGLALTNDAGAEIVGAYNHHCCSFRDDPRVEDNDANFIAAAPTDVARLTGALEAVLELADAWEEEFPHKAWRVRAAFENALEESK
ncbi:MAG: hypothetical protein M3536_09255 [Actinomycetota bacterium]|nr:hypothetical protein [Actinomycetota bacterium]